MAANSNTRELLLEWLKRNFEFNGERNGRTWKEKFPVSDLKVMAVSEFGESVNDKILGSALRVAFPSVKRQHAQGPSFYYGLKVKRESASEVQHHQGKKAQIQEKAVQTEAKSIAKQSACFDFPPGILSFIPKDRFLNRNHIYDIDNKETILGEGTFARVKIKQYRKFAVAVKEYKSNAEFSSKHSRNRVLREAKTLINISPHECIPVLFGLIIDSEPFWLVMELCTRHEKSFTLLKLARSNTEGITDKNLVEILTKLAQGLHHIHLNGIIHNDLKLDNVTIIKLKSTCTFTMHDWIPVILDFGESTSILKAVKRKYGSFHSHVDPMVLSGEKIHSVLSDVYSLGVIVEKMVSVAASKKVKDLMLQVSTLCKEDQDRPNAEAISLKLQAILHNEF